MGFNEESFQNPVTPRFVGGCITYKVPQKCDNLPSFTCFTFLKHPCFIHLSADLPPVRPDSADRWYSGHVGEQSTALFPNVHIQQKQLWTIWLFSLFFPAEIPIKTPPAGPVFGRLICFVLYRESVECIMFNYRGLDVCGASINVWSWHTLAPARLGTGKLPLSQNQTELIFHIFNWYLHQP